MRLISAVECVRSCQRRRINGGVYSCNGGWGDACRSDVRPKLLSAPQAVLGRPMSTPSRAPTNQATPSGTTLPTLTIREVKRIHEWMDGEGVPVPENLRPATMEGSKRAHRPMRYLLQATAAATSPGRREREEASLVASSPRGHVQDNEMLQVEGRATNTQPHPLGQYGREAGELAIGARRDGLVVVEAADANNDVYRLQRRYRKEKAEFSMRVHNYGPHDERA